MKRMIFAVAGAVFTSLAGPAASQDTMVEYFTLLGPADAFNSRVVPLNDLCDIVQQDRANWHRFGNREQYDGGD